MPRPIEEINEPALTAILVRLDQDATALSDLLVRIPDRQRIADPALLGVLTSGHIVIHAIDTLISWYLSGDE